MTAVTFVTKMTAVLQALLYMWQAVNVNWVFVGIVNRPDQEPPPACYALTKPSALSVGRAGSCGDRRKAS